MSYHHDRPVPKRKPQNDVADAAAWAAFIRGLLGWTDITKLADDQDHIIDTEFRQWAGLPKRTESAMRRQAAEQVLASRKAGTR